MKNWKRILEIVKKTGERFLFSDDDGNFFVISALEDFENDLQVRKIKKMSEEELLNKINNDIAFWQASQGQGTLPDSWDELREKLEENEEDQYYFETNDEHN